MEFALITLFVFLVILIIKSGSGSEKKSFSKGFNYSENSYDRNKLDKEWNEHQEKRKKFIDLYNSKNWDGLISNFENEELEKLGNGFSDYQGLGVAYLNTNQFDKAESAFNKAIDGSDPVSSSKAALNLAIFYRDLGHLEKTIEWVLKSNPNLLRKERQWDDFYRSMRVGGTAFRDLGLVEEGITFLKNAPISARIIDNNLADVFELLGELSAQKSDFKNALKYFQKVVTVRYDKAINAKILDLNQLIYEEELVKDEMKRKRLKNKNSE